MGGVASIGVGQWTLVVVSWCRGGGGRPAPHAHVGEGLVTVLCGDMAAGTGTSRVVVVSHLLRVLRVEGASRALWRISRKTHFEIVKRSFFESDPD